MQSNPQKGIVMGKPAATLTINAHLPQRYR